MNQAKRVEIERRAERDSDINELRPRKDGRGKRSTKDMLAECENPLEEAFYALSRLEAQEDSMSKLLRMLSREAREIVFKRRPSLRRYNIE